MMPWIILSIIVGILVIFFVIKHFVWDLPHQEISGLKYKLTQKETEYSKHAETSHKSEEKLNLHIEGLQKSLDEMADRLEITQKNEDQQKLRIEKLQKLLDDSVFFSEVAKSNLRAIPYKAAIMADFETYGLENLARKLYWGTSQERLKKVKSIREIRKDATLLCALDRIFDDATVFKLRGESFRGKKLETISLQTGKVKAVEPITATEE